MCQLGAAGLQRLGKQSLRRWRSFNLPVQKSGIDRATTRPTAES